ncbi:hypothetical protein BOX15_Mlig014827g1, partial [Macrostomum lignano]
DHMPLRSLWRWYSRAIHTRPILTQSLSSGIIMGFGDATVQCVTLLRLKSSIDQHPSSSSSSSLSYLTDRFDYSRTIRYFLLSSLLIGPGLRCWYVFLSRQFELTNYGRLKMLIADQGLMPPIMWLTFLSYTSVVVRGDRSAAAVKEFVLDRLPAMAVNSYRVWPLAQAINFFIVPLNFRLVYGSFVGYFWNCYICWHSNRPH